MTISERFKKEHPEVTYYKILYRGDGTVILEVKNGEKGVKRALTVEEMRTFYSLMRIAESSANDYMYVKLTEVAKEIEDDQNLRSSS